MNLCAPPSTHKRKEQKRKASDRLNQPPINFSYHQLEDQNMKSLTDDKHCDKGSSRPFGQVELMFNNG